MTDFSGRTVLITGAAGGIGQALVAHFLAHGARVIAHDRTSRDLEKLSGIVPLTADLRDRAAFDAGLAAAVTEAGPVEILINNAGRAVGKTLALTTPESFDEDIDVNLKGTFGVTMAVVPAMKARRKGVIVNIGTVNALNSFGHPAYSAAKAGMISMTRSMAVELGRWGIRVNVVCPGTVRTPAWQDRVRVQPDVLEQVTRWYPLHRIVEPEELARVVAFLASDDAAIITGAVLVADCGLTAGMPPVVGAFTLEEI
ncbi:MAG: SDR family oxidoreductase [Acetobacteraceae bacterium]